jgi:hypothetical protein
MTTKTVWILTKEYNDYDQHGEYFVAVFFNKPSHVVLTKEGVPTHRLKQVLDGGGRFDSEDNWHHLREVTPNE